MEYSMDREKKLLEIIKVAQDELRGIQLEKRIKENKESLGKCYKEYVDNGSSLITYTCVESIDIWGNLHGRVFDVGGHNEWVTIYEGDRELRDASYLSKYSVELTREEFETTYAVVLSILSLSLNNK